MQVFGRADREIWVLALPTFATLVSEPLLLLADSAIIGHLSTDALAGLGSAANVINLLVGLSIFLAYGTTATVARRLGAGDRVGALAGGLGGMQLAVIVGIVVGGAVSALAPVIVGWYDGTPAVHRQAATYLRIMACALPAALTMLASTGVLRGLRDTRTPLIVAVAVNLINIGLNATLVFPAGMGIAGSATGSLISQYLAASVLAGRVIIACRREGVPLRLHAGSVIAAARSGAWLLLRTAELQLAVTVTTLTAAALGTTALAAHQVGNSMWTMLAFALDAVAIAGQTIVGRALGAGQLVQVRTLSRRMVAWGLGLGGLFGVIMLVARPVYLWIFTDDADVRALLAEVIIVFAIIAPLNGVVFVLDGILIGAGDARYLAIGGAGAALAYLVVVGALRAVGLTGWGSVGLIWLWSGYCGYMIFRLVVLGIRYRTDGWMRVGISAGEPATD